MPRTTSTDTRWLERHGQTWRVTVAVPRDLRHLLGTRLKRTLATDSLAVANALKLTVVSELRARIQQARESKLGKSRAVIREAMEVAKHVRLEARGTETGYLDREIQRRAQEILGPEVGRSVVDDGDEQVELSIYDPTREALSKDYLAVAYGHAVPMASAHAEYLAKSLVKSRTKADDVRAIQYLSEWCEKEGVPQTLQAMNRKTAARFMDALDKLRACLT